MWWLAALASGPAAYEDFVAVAGSPLGYVVLAGISWAFFNHLVSGLRHFVLDIGAGYELSINKSFSVLSPVLGVGLTVAFWALLLWR